MLTLEIFISFLVLFAVLSMLLYQYQKISEPIGFDYENVWVANLDIPIDADSSKVENQAQLQKPDRDLPGGRAIEF